ncbi:phage integrase N-terminal SAM-like domain-containing protein, partial [Accumulibacter sp.]|uniref:phage integrase N-terminal SAM-like domain-containing protein n=1 Tax=Accumulibacter sp. TaxID=2053492 RepID=UPI002C903695
MAAQGVRGPFQIDRVPLHDGRRHQVEAYLLHLIRDKKLAYASVNQASCAFRFLFRRVLGRSEAGFDIPMAKVPKRLPQILS